MTFIINKSVQFETTDCCVCGVVFAVHAAFLNERKEDKKSFFCPNGHSQSFVKSTTQILQQQINKLKTEKDEAERARYSLHNQLSEKQEEVKKLKSNIAKRNKRIAAGVCPCCNKTVKQLAAHMKSKHPEQIFTPEIHNIHRKINRKRTLTY